MTRAEGKHIIQRITSRGEGENEEAHAYEVMKKLTAARHRAERGPSVDMSCTVPAPLEFDVAMEVPVMPEQYKAMA